MTDAAPGSNRELTDLFDVVHKLSGFLSDNKDLFVLHLRVPTVSMNCGLDMILYLSLWFSLVVMVFEVH